MASGRPQAVVAVPGWMMWFPGSQRLEQWPRLMWPAVLAAWSVKWLALRPVKTAVGLLVLAVWAAAGWELSLVALLILVGAGASLRSPGVAASGRVGRSYRSCQARGELRRGWAPLMARAKLTDGDGRPVRHGRITRTRTGLATDVHTGAAMLRPDDVRSAAPKLAGALGVHSVRARTLDSATVRLTIHERNPFAETIKLSQLPRVTTGSQVPLGIDDEGEVILWPLELSTLLLGEPGSGKSSAIWCALEGIQHWEDQPRPELDVIDLKEGVELGSLDPAVFGIANRYTEDPKSAEKLVHDTVREGARRLQLMKANGWRKWRPEYAEVLGPRRILLIDEFLALPKKMTGDDRSPLREVLFKHRAAGVTVIGASQLSQVESGAVGRVRNLFPVKIILAQESQGMVQAVAGGESTEAPAHLLQLPADAGRFYIRQEGRSGWVAGKAAFVDDEAGEHLPIARGEVSA